MQTAYYKLIIIIIIIITIRYICIYSVISKFGNTNLINCIAFSQILFKKNICLIIPS